MEDWQKSHITQNLPNLIRSTRFNVLVKAELLAQNILDEIDVDDLDGLHSQRGNFDISCRYYQLLKTRPNAYKVLTKALLDNRQTDAARILIDGVPENISDKPLTYLGIPIKLDGLKDMEIEVNGKELTLQEFLPNANYEKFQQIFKDTASELEIYDTLVMKQRTFVLAKNTVPSKPTYYVPRLLSNRIKIHESIFKADCTDVFVIKNSLPRYRLSQIAKPNFTDTSTSQLSNITCRFIYLEENDDWIELKKFAKVPIHLINYEDKGNVFLLEDSSAPSNILTKPESRDQRVYMTEETFVRQKLSENCTLSSVCICDKPGMGKTFLLANIGRHMTKKCTGNIIVFIQLTTFAEDFCSGSTNSLSEPETSLTNLLSYTCSFKQNPKFLLELVKAKLILLKILFDGFDELPIDKVACTKQVFQQIRTNFPNVSIYITSRPHMRQELEESLGVVAYDILPFNQQNQIDFLVQFWQNTELCSHQPSLIKYAIDCLEAVNTSLTKNDKEIAGIPLLCRLIAEIYGDNVSLHSVKSENLFDTPLKISEMYEKFIEKQILLITNNKEEFDTIKLIHIWNAVNLLFPTSDFLEDKQFNTVKCLLTSPKILRVGILQKRSNGALEFIHRTFAEYLVAEFISTMLQEKNTSTNDDVNSRKKSMLKVLLSCRQERMTFPERDLVFVHQVTVSFFNSTLAEVNVSEEQKTRTGTYITSLSYSEFIYILCACCQHNLFNIFTFLTAVLTKCDNSWILECFTERNCYELLSICIWRSTSQMFHSCVQLFTEVLKFDIAQIVIDKHSTLLQRAVECANYEAVEYFVEKFSLKNQSLLKKCVECCGDVEKKENILYLLLNKDHTLIDEAPNILVDPYIRSDLRLFKILAKFGANLTAVTEDNENCAVYAVEYLYPSDIHELINFLLNECKAEYLFRNNMKWVDPLHEIIKRASLLPDTLVLLLNIPGIDIKDEDGENLSFSAVKGNQVGNLQLLVDRGLDYNARGRRNRGLLHMAAQYGDVNMVQYLLSLKLDPNSRDTYKWSPLHYAVNIICADDKLPVIIFFLENGANVRAKTSNGQTALHLSATQIIGPSTKVIEYLIRKGAGVNDHDNNGNTPLHLCKDMKVTELLLKMGADIYAKNNMGETPAQINPWPLN